VREREGKWHDAKFKDVGRVILVLLYNLKRCMIIRDMIYVKILQFITDVVVTTIRNERCRYEKCFLIAVSYIFYKQSISILLSAL